MKNYLRIFSLLFLSTQLAAQSTFASKTNELSKVEKNSQNKKKSKENSKKIKTSKKPNTANANKSTDSKIVEKLESDLSRINSSIDITKNKIRTAIEIGFLPDLYYMLAELLVDKARIMTVLKKESQPGTPESELDFTSEKRVRSEAIETFKLIEERYPTYSELDKVLFTMAQIISHQGSPDEAITIYKKITLKYPMSKYGLKSHLEIGNIFFDKKDFEFAAEQYKKLIQINPNSEESQRALYKNGWCLNYLGKFFEAFQNYRKVLELIQLNPNSLEKNSENSNLQEETLVAMIWPYSELTTQELSEIPDVLNPILFFEKSSPDKSSFRRILNRFGQRMEIKERHKEASDAYLELFRLSDDLVEKKDALEKYYINVKKINVGLLPLWFSKEVSQILWSLSSEEKVKKSTKFDINPYEPILRDVATQIHQMGLKTKRREDLIAAAEAYDNYLWIFPQNKWTSSIQLNMAEAYYHAEDYVKAGLLYFKIATLKTKVKKTSRRELLNSSIESFTEALKRSENLSHLERLQGREGFRSVADLYFKTYPNSENLPNIQFNFAKSLYDEQKFQEATESLKKFISAYPKHTLTSQAAVVLLDCFYIRNDMKGLLAQGKILINNPEISDDLKTQLGQIMQQAQLKGVQSIAGDFTSKKYADRFLSFAKQNKGSALGEQALMEAFTSLKSNQDPKAYQVGEQYLGQYPTSSQAKGVLESMIQMSLVTADYSRAAKYMAIFGTTFSQDPSSKEYLLQAAQLDEQLGELTRSAENYNLLGRYLDEARIYKLDKNWNALNQVAAKLNGNEGRYYQGLALYRMGKKEEGLLLLQRALDESSTSLEVQELITHAGVIVSENELESFQNLGFGAALSVASLKEKINRYREIDNRIQEGISKGSGKWIISNIYLLGVLSKNFSEYLKTVEIPPELNNEAFKSTIKKQEILYFETAKKHFVNCLKSAEENEIFTRYVKACRSLGVENIKESQELIPRFKSSSDDSEEIVKIRKELIQSPRSMDLLKKYAIALLEKKNFAGAMAVVRRQIEIEPNQSENYAFLGVLQMYMNLFDESIQSFKEALKREPQNVTALLGTYSLYKNFGFKTKVSSLEPKMNKKLKPLSPIHPWMK